MISIIAAWIAVLLVIPASLRAEIRLPSIISDHMVLLRSDTTPLWGWGSPGESVTVTYLDTVATTTVDPDGKWQVALKLNSAKASPADLTIQGSNSLVIHDVVVGEVWLAAGQSNMQVILQSFVGVPEMSAKADVAASDNPLIREFCVKDALSDKPESNCGGCWVVATPATTPGFSAVGYYFARTLQKNVKAPIGIIHSSYGSSQVEAWTSRESLDSNEDLREGCRRVLATVEGFPLERQNYEKAYEKWLEDTGRKDRESVHAAEWAAPDAPKEGWTPVVLPLVPPPDGFPKFGAYWLRRQVVVPPNGADRQMAIGFHDLSGFGTIYWNGEKVVSTSIHDISPSYLSSPRTRSKPARTAWQYGFIPPSCKYGLRRWSSMGSLCMTGAFARNTNSHRCLPKSNCPPAPRILFPSSVDRRLFSTP